MKTALDTILQNDVLVSAFTLAIVGLLYRLVGAAGSALEALGAERGWPALIVLGKRMEAVGYDAPKLKGLPGASEAPAPVRASDADSAPLEPGKVLESAQEDSGSRSAVGPYSDKS